jgi:hypothetical protein
MARDIRGIGFKTADAIAMKLGIEKTAMVRVRAGISYALTEAMDDGHCGLPTAYPSSDFLAHCGAPATANQAKGWVGISTDANLAPLRRGFF